jgi:hypothetical protein
VCGPPCREKSPLWARWREGIVEVWDVSVAEVEFIIMRGGRHET